MHLICVCWAAEFGSDHLTLPEIYTVPYLVKELRKKNHEQPKDGPGGAEAEGGDEIDSEDPDSAPPQKRGWLGRHESKLKQVLCF
jgi:hypothetical protein